MLQALVLAGIGLWLSRGRVRAGLALLLGGPVVALLVASATVGYNARYVVPLEGPLIAAGAIGLWVILDQVRGRHDHGAGSSRRPAPG